MWFFRSRLTEAETLTLLVMAGLLTMFAHTYTLAGLIVTMPVLCGHLDRRRWVASVALGLGALIMAPRRLMHELGQTDALLHWRVPLILALLIIALIVLRECDKNSKPLGQDNRLSFYTTPH
jgi:Zn-dependent protease